MLAGLEEEAFSPLGVSREPLNLLQHLAPMLSNAIVFVLEPAGLSLVSLLETNARLTLETGVSGISEPRALAMVIRMLHAFALLEHHGLSMSVIHASLFAFGCGQHCGAEEFLTANPDSMACSKLPVKSSSDDFSAFDGSLKLVCLESCKYYYELDAAKRSAAFFCDARPSEPASSVASSAEAATAFQTAVGQFCEDFLQQCSLGAAKSCGFYAHPSKLCAVRMLTTTELTLLIAFAPPFSCSSCGASAPQIR